MGYIDLHTHSNVSDGTLSPSELINYAASKGVAVLALTDHDTALGLSEAQEAALSLDAGFTFIPGIELSAAYGSSDCLPISYKSRNRDIHILGYYINPGEETLSETIKASVTEREARNLAIIERFRSHGINMTVKELTSGCPAATITRAHFARFLMLHGYVRDNDEAFEKYLGYDCPFYVPRKHITPEEAVRAILSAGGIPVLAHPLIYGLDAHDLNALVKRLKEHGLMGIETFYSSNINNDESYIAGLAARYGLLMTGGSDFHGANKPHIEIGTGRGNLRVPASVYDELEKKHSGLLH